MSVVDKSGSEAFTLIEESRKSFPPPTTYTQCREALLAYRKKVMSDLVGGRVSALLDAGHDSLAKYKDQLGKLDVVAYLFMNLRRNALAIKFKGKDIGTGQYENISAEFVSPVTDYPLNPPYAVPQRSLPQVDIFRFTPYGDIDLSEVSGLAQLKSAVLIQIAGGTFVTSPDMENALYDFFFIYPQCKVRGRWLFTTPYEQNYEAWNGEYCLFECELRTANIETCYAYLVHVWVDSDVEQPLNLANPRWHEPMLSWINTLRREHDTWYDPSGAPVTEISIIGRRVASSDERLYGCKTTTGFMVGYNLKAESFSVDTSEPTWYNNWNIIISVNDVARGTTTPVPDTYVKRALDGFEVTAIPTAPYVFDHWELDGLNIGNANPYYMYPLKNAELKAVFL